MTRNRVIVVCFGSCLAGCQPPTKQAELPRPAVSRPDSEAKRFEPLPTETPSRRKAESKPPSPTAAGDESPFENRCFTQEELERHPSALRAMAYRITPPLSVVNVAHDDVLNVRRSASPNANIVATLAHDAAQLEPTGAVCFVGQRPWLELRSGTMVGWVNGKYVHWATPSQDATTEYATLLGQSDFGSPQALVEAFKAALYQRDAIPELNHQISTLALTQTGDTAQAEVTSCCFADDSLQAVQLSLSLVRKGRQWQLHRVNQRTLCVRGVSGDLCL